MDNLNCNMNIYTDIANAIVAQAIEDYRVALRGQWVDDNRSNKSVLREVERFIHSPWYDV